MKKYFFIAISLLLILALCGCGTSAASESASTEPSSAAAQNASTEPSPTETPAAAPGASASASPGQTADYSEIGFTLMDSESLDGVKVGQTADEVTALLGEPEETTEPEVWGADGSEHQTWSYASKGLELDIVGEGDDLIVGSISADSAFTGKTVAGIGIGSGRADVLTAYAGKIDPQSDPEHADTIVAGTVYGGVLFTIQDNAVDAIFIGAASE